MNNHAVSGWIEVARRGVEDLERDLFIVDETSGQTPARSNGGAQLASAEGKQRPANSFGRRLRQAREARGLSQTDVSRALKFTTSQIDALENGSLRNMAPVYATGFVRCYAEYLGEKALGSSPCDAVVAFQAEHGLEACSSDAGPSAKRRRFRFPRLPGFSVIIACFVLSIGVFATWHFFKDPSATASPVVGEAGYQDALADIVVVRSAP